MLIDMKCVRLFSNKVFTTEFSWRRLKTATLIAKKYNITIMDMHCKTKQLVKFLL